jgi:hypothetical protein
MRSIHVRSLFPALLLLLALPITSQAQIRVGVSINIEPPALPVYEQPPLPEVGYMWTPGYWGYGPDGYFWVPGTWVQPPSVGVLWTPGYWGFNNGAYVFNAGYWGPHIGFYGGVNYGFGYGGVGFEGGEWRGGGFFYNQAVVHFGSDVHVTNVYTKTVIVNNTTRVSFNGGAHGTSARPTPAEMSADHEHHVAPTAAQTSHVHEASTNHALLASVNHGAPAIAATQKPGEFSGKGVVKAKAASASHPTPATREAKTPAASHEAVAHPAAPKPAAKPAAKPMGERPEAKPMAEHPAPAAPHAAPPPKAAPRPPAKGPEEKKE